MRRAAAGAAASVAFGGSRLSAVRDPVCDGPRAQPASAAARAETGRRVRARGFRGQVWGLGR